MKFKNIVLISTKGGVGKSKISWHLMPYFFQNRDFEIIEIDNNNDTPKAFTRSEMLANRMSSFDISKGVEKLEEVVISNMLIENKINIVDSGGGDDTKAVIDMLQKNKMMDETLFVIPFMPDFEQIENVIDTYQLVQNHQFIVILNNANLKDDNDMAFATGDDDMEIPNFSEMFKNKFFVVPRSKYFSIAAGKYKENIFDFAKIAFEMDQQSSIDMVKSETNSNVQAMLSMLRKYKEADNAKDYLLSPEIDELRRYLSKAV